MWHTLYLIFVHYLRQGSLTSVVIRIRIRIRIRICDPDGHQNLTICSLAHCQSSLKISCKSVGKFLRKVANSYMTNRQTNHNDYVSSLTEVTIIRNADAFSNLTSASWVFNKVLRSTRVAVWPIVVSALNTSTRMWANAQRHDRPSEYRWRRLFNAAKFGWRGDAHY